MPSTIGGIEEITGDTVSRQELNCQPRNCGKSSNSSPSSTCASTHCASRPKPRSRTRSRRSARPCRPAWSGMCCVAEQSGLLAALNAVENGLCFGRIDLTTGVTHHIGRIGMRADDAERTPLLIDWRARRRPALLPRHRPHPDGAAPPPPHHHRGPRGHRPARRDPRPRRRRRAPGTRTPTGDAVLLAALDAAPHRPDGRHRARPSRPSRTRSSAPRTAGCSSSRAARAPARPPSPCTGPRTCCTRTASCSPRRAVLIVGPNPAFLGYIGEVLPVARRDRRAAVHARASCSPACTPPATDTARAAAVKGRAAMADVLAAVVADRQAAARARPSDDRSSDRRACAGVARRLRDLV